jgi:hypothetical protein
MSTRGVIMSNEYSADIDFIAEKFLKGRIIPFFGAGVNLYGRTDPSDFALGETLPDGKYLSQFLSAKCKYPAEDTDNLLRVSQYFQSKIDEMELYDELHLLFDHDYLVTPLHDFFASLPKLLNRKTGKYGYQFIITTNYDDLLERACKSIDEPFDLVIYKASRICPGLFVHRPHGGAPREIKDPSTCNEVTAKERTVIMKIHGSVARSPDLKDSYVITEDNYINYLSHTDIANLIPVRLREKMEESSFLFLGYSLRDWNLRVIFNRIWREQELGSRSWAVQLKPDPIEIELWKTRGVKIISLALEDFIGEMERRFQ